MLFGTTVGLELVLLLLYYRECLKCDLCCLVLRLDWNWAYSSCLGDGLGCDLCCLVLRWDSNWVYCCCIIGSVWDVTCGVWYCGGNGIGLFAVVLYWGFEMLLMVFGTRVGLELGLVLLYYRECLKCDLCCLILRLDWNWAYCSCVGDGLRCDLWFLVLRWEWNWTFCCCIIGRFWDITYGVWN